MSDDLNFFLLSFDNIDETQRTLVQSRVEAMAVSWWHQQTNVWIVSGGTSANEWKEALGVFVPRLPSSLYVFKLPNGNRDWAAHHAVSKWQWILETYALPGGTHPKGVEQPPPTDAR